MLHEADHGTRSLSHLRFIWAVRHTKFLDNLPTVATTYKNDKTEEGQVAEEQVQTTDSYFHPEIYVTRARDDEDLESRPHTYKGRPDISKIIKEIVVLAEEQGVRRVAVITCGPQPMVNQVKNSCRKMNGVCCGVTLDVHDEIFSF